MAVEYEFFQPEALGKLAGAVAVVTAVSVTIRRISGLNTPWVPFFTSLVVTYVAAGAAGSLHAMPSEPFPSAGFFGAVVSWLMPLLNACLLFTSVVGVTETVGALDGHEKQQRRIEQIRALPPADRNEAIRLELGIVPDERSVDQYIRLSSLRIKNRLFRSWFEKAR
jgi:hypothetical protein